MATDSNLYEVQTSDQFKRLLSEDLQRVSLLYFWAPWAEPCKQMSEVVTELSKKYPKLLSLKIEAEKQEEISESFAIESVPTFIILRVRRTFIFFSPELDHSNPPFIVNVGSHFTGPHNRCRCLLPLHRHWEARRLCGAHHTAFPFRQVPHGAPSRGESGDARRA